MTVRELAKMAGVSPSTVSKAFSGAPDVSQKTAEKIFRLAKENGCFGKFSKAKFQKAVFAIICHELGNFYAEYVKTLQRIIEENGGVAVIACDGFSQEAQAQMLEYFGAFAEIDGVFVIGLKEPIKRGLSLPVVSILSDREVAADAINADITTPFRDAVLKLRTLGHKKIAFIGEGLTVGKEKIFCSAARLTRDDPLVCRSAFRFQKAGEDGVRQLLSRRAEFTAVVCAYDEIALGAIRELKKRGLQVPVDVSVVGVDNTVVAEYAETPLASVGANIEELCLLAWEQMQQKQKNKFYRSKQQITLKGEFLPRETVAPPKK